MKLTSILVTLIAALVAIPLTAAALPITIDFSKTATTDITLPHTATVDQVTFAYDNTTAGFGTATVDTSGIVGDTGFLDPGPPVVEANNVLSIDFTATPIPQIYRLLINFHMPGMSTTDPYGSFADMFFLGVPVGHVDVEVQQGDVPASMLYVGPAFDKVFMSFSADAPKFYITEITYEAVPEPGTIILVAAGLLGLGVLRRSKKI